MRVEIKSALRQKGKNDEGENNSHNSSEKTVWLTVADSEHLIQAFDISIYDIDLMHINSTNAL